MVNIPKLTNNPTHVNTSKLNFIGIRTMANIVCEVGTEFELIRDITDPDFTTPDKPDFLYSISHGDGVYFNFSAYESRFIEIAKPKGEITTANLITFIRNQHYYKAASDRLYRLAKKVEKENNEKLRELYEYEYVVCGKEKESYFTIANELGTDFGIMNDVGKLRHFAQHGKYILNHENLLQYYCDGLKRNTFDYRHPAEITSEINNTGNTVKKLSLADTIKEITTRPKA